MSHHGSHHHHHHKRYFLAVDGFRLLASMNIVLFHLQGIGGLWDMREKPLWLFHILKGPAFHASVFFLLGGFIFTIKFAEKATNFSTWEFLKKRFSELYPLHLGTTLTMAALKIVYCLHHGGLDLPKLGASVFMHLSLLWSLFPFGTYALNRPSWALSAFFLCYLLFGVVLRQVVRIKRKRFCVIFSLLCMMPILGWTLLYGALGMPADLYPFFHTFGLVRFFEFLIGMLLARFFQLSSVSEKHTVREAVLNDLLIAAAGGLVIFSLWFRTADNGFFTYFSYHVLMIPLYFIILYGLAVERGVISRLLSFSFVRKTGRSSFYPYLIHIPLISVFTFILEHYFHYNTFLHHPVNIVVFMIVLYGGGYLYVNRIRKRKPSGPHPVKG